MNEFIHSQLNHLSRIKDVTRPPVTTCMVRIDFAGWVLVLLPLALQCFCSSQLRAIHQARLYVLLWLNLYPSMPQSTCQTAPQIFKENRVFSLAVVSFPGEFSPRFFICTSFWGMTSKTKGTATRFPLLFILVQVFYRETIFIKNNSSHAWREFQFFRNYAVLQK